MTLYLLTVLTLFLSTSNAVGWVKLNKLKAIEFNFDINLEYDTQNQCHKVIVDLPLEIQFRDIGQRSLWKVNYKKIENKVIGWQLMSKGTEIELPILKGSSFSKIRHLCLSNEDLKTSYLSSYYVGAPGTPPMVMIISLIDFKNK